MRIRALALICSFSVILSTVLAGCGGGGGGGSDGSAGGSSEDTSDANTRQTLANTNLNVGPGGGAALGTLKRWSLPIPVKTNGDARAVQAMDAIEQRLGMTVFDRASIAGTDDASITRGLIVRTGTGPQSALCGSADPGNGANAEMTGVMFIDLDSPTCTATVAATIHEFGHTLGLYNHFQNFGIGSATGALFWRVLRTVYMNPIGTPAASIVLAAP